MKRALPIVPAIIVFLLLFPVARPVEGSGDTFQFWYAGHLAVTGRSVYDVAEWQRAGPEYGHIAGNVARNCSDRGRAECTWLYPPLTAWLFAPFGVVAPPAGTLLVDALVLLTTLAGVIAAAVAFGPREPRVLALLLTVAVAAHPFVVNIRAGHFVGLLLLGLAAVALGLRAHRALPLAVGATVLALKAHLFVVLAPAVALRLGFERRWREMAIAGGVPALLVTIALARSPDAISAIVSGSAGKSGIAWSTPAAVAAAVAPSAPLAVFVLIIAVSSFAAARAIAAEEQRRDHVVIAATCALSLIVTPYAQPYDLLLLVPAFALVADAAARLAQPRRTLLLAAMVVAYLVAPWAGLIVGSGQALGRAIYGTTPVIALLLLAVRPPTRDR